MRGGELAITGAGVVCALGADLPSFAARLRDGSARGACAAPEFARALSLHEARRLDRLSQLLVVAGREAAAQANVAAVPEDERGVVAGTALGCLEKTEAQLRGIARDGVAYADPMSFADSMGNAPAAHVAMACGCRGISLTVMERELSGESAVVLAARLLGAGAARAILVVAGDALSPAFETVLARMAPQIVPGEGAGALVIETAESARGRGARILARLRGYAIETSLTAAGRLHAAGPEIVARARERAMAMARLAEDEVLAVAPEVLRGRIGWFMADGLVHAVTALTALDGAHRRAAVVSKCARGATAAALVIGSAETVP